MKYTITHDRRQLIITADADEQKELREWPGDRCLPDHTPESIGSDEAMCEFLEPLTCNSELEWINPADTGDLTDAPMLGIRDYNKRDGTNPVLERWWFPDYCVRSVLEDLRDKGIAIFSC